MRGPKIITFIGFVILCLIVLTWTDELLILVRNNGGWTLISRGVLPNFDEARAGINNVYLPWVVLTAGGTFAFAYLFAKPKG